MIPGKARDASAEREGGTVPAEPDAVTRAHEWPLFRSWGPTEALVTTCQLSGLRVCQLIDSSASGSVTTEVSLSAMVRQTLDTTSRRRSVNPALWPARQPPVSCLFRGQGDKGNHLPQFSVILFEPKRSMRVLAPPVLTAFSRGRSPSEGIRGAGLENVRWARAMPSFWAAMYGWHAVIRLCPKILVSSYG